MTCISYEGLTNLAILLICLDPRVFDKIGQFSMEFHIPDIKKMISDIIRQAANR